MWPDGVKKKKVVMANMVDLPPGHVAGIQTSYMCLCHKVSQSDGNHDEEASKFVASKYYQRTRQVVKNQLNGKNKICALRVTRSAVGIARWTKKDKETEDMDVKIRKPLITHGNLYSKSNTQRL